MSSLIGALRVTLGLDTAAFEKGATRAELKAKGLGNNAEALGHKVGRMGKALAIAGAGFMGGAVVSQLRSMAREGLEYAGSLGEAAQQLGVTTSALQQYRFIATQVGIEQEVMDKGLVKLSGRLGQLAAGAKGAEAPFARLKLSQQDFIAVSKMTAEQALPFLADKFAALASDTERVAAAQGLFGAKMGGKFLSLLAGGSKGINDLAAAYKQLGIEISSEQIGKADKALDNLSSLEKVVKAKTAQISADHSGMVIKFESNWAQFKIDAMQAAVDFGEVKDKIDKVLQEEVPDPWEALVAEWPQTGREWEQVGKAISKATSNAFGAVIKWALDLKISIANSFGAAVGWAQKLHDGVVLWLKTKLGAALDWVRGKTKDVGDAFFTLYDRVVGHSYIPDMVDGIALHMARLDAVMVDPALSATERTKQAFEKLKTDVTGLMRNLFPEAAELADFRTKLGNLNEGIKLGGIDGWSADQLQAGRDRLIDGATSDQLANGGVSLADRLRQIGSPGDAARDVQKQLENLSAAANDNADEVNAATVRIAKSFKDMASESLSRLQDLTSAIKGGGFLDILSAVLNLGADLGSKGLFGKNVASFFNKVPGYAGGTGFHPGGLAMVGERGPELVNLPRGSSVTPNHALKGGGNTINNFYGPGAEEFWGRINQGDAQAAQSGARGGEARVMYRGSRRLG